MSASDIDTEKQSIHQGASILRLLVWRCQRGGSLVAPSTLPASLTRLRATPTDTLFIAVEEVALHGHVATDKHGHALIHIDPAAEARLRRKMDIRILPVVALMYLFCFIDRYVLFEAISTASASFDKS